METKSTKDQITVAKKNYFAGADAVLARRGLSDPSPEALRKLLKLGKNEKNVTSKKAAS